MKSIVSISVDEELIEQIDLFLNDQNFRNKSHFIETAIKQYMIAGRQQDFSEIKTNIPEVVRK